MVQRVLEKLGILWALPITLSILLIVALLRMLYPNSGIRWVRVRYPQYGGTSMVAVWGYPIAGILKFMPPNGVEGVTLGHVVLFRNAWSIRGIGAHEFEHVRQYMCWGFLFPLVYGLESLWQFVHQRHYYWDNRFEKAAYQRGRERFFRVSKRKS